MTVIEESLTRRRRLSAGDHDVCGFAGQQLASQAAISHVLVGRASFVWTTQTVSDELTAA
jgi:hypothetical protein